MSDNKKTIEMDSFDFEDISGGVEQKVSLNLPATELTPVADTTLVQATGLKESYHLPVPTPDGKWKLIDIIDISGEDFLLWAESVYPPFKVHRVNPERLSGPKALFERKTVVNDIAEFHKRGQQYGRKIDTDKILQ